MTVTVTVEISDQPARVVVATDAALDAIRFSFNPSQLPRVTLLKALAAAFLTECGAIVDRDPTADDESREARKFAISASMWAVLGATKGL